MGKIQRIMASLSTLVECDRNLFAHGALQQMNEAYRTSSVYLPEASNPLEMPNGYWLAVHLHPGVTLREGKRGAALRLPCFSFGEHGAVLPAFGSFTGFTRVEPEAANHCFAIADHLVARVPFTPDGGDHASS